MPVPVIAYAVRGSSGFTLVEVMLALVISSILSMVAVPNISSWLDASRAKSVRQQLRSLTMEARSLALYQAQTTTVCRLKNGICDSQFGFPVSVFVDSNHNATLDFDESVFRILDIELPDRVSMHWNRSGYLRFWPSGGSGALTGSLSYCDQRSSDNDFRLVVARTGRVRIDQSETRCS